MLIVEEAVPGDADRNVGTLCAFAKFFCEPKNALKVVLKTKQTKKNTEVLEWKSPKSEIWTLTDGVYQQI